MPGIPRGCQCQRCLYPLSLLRHATEGKSKLSPGVGLSSSTQNCLSLLLLLLALLLSFFSPAAWCLWVIFTLPAACQKDWSGLFLFFFFPPRHTWKLFLVVWVFCILRIIKGLSCKESGKGRALIIINSAKANNILG